MYLISAIASPVAGWLIDRLGRAPVWVAASLTASAAAHALLAFGPAVPPALPVILLGLAYSVLASALWTVPAGLVISARLATAFGIMQSLQVKPNAILTCTKKSVWENSSVFFKNYLLLCKEPGYGVGDKRCWSAAGGPGLHRAPARFRHHPRLGRRPQSHPQLSHQAGTSCSHVRTDLTKQGKTSHRLRFVSIVFNFVKPFFSLV